MKIWELSLTGSIFLIIGIFLGIIADDYFLFDLVDLAYFGDAFSGLFGVIISLITALLVYITYKRQSKHMSHTIRAFNHQKEQQNYSNFYNVLFKFIERLDHLIDGIEYNPLQTNGIEYDRDTEITLSGNNAVIQMLADLEGYYKHLEAFNSELPEEERKTHKEIVDQSRRLTVLSSFTFVFPFVGMIRNILLHIDKSPLDTQQKQFAADFLIDSVSTFELIVFHQFVDNTFSDSEPENDQFKLNGAYELAKKYNLFLAFEGAIDHKILDLEPEP